MAETNATGTPATQTNQTHGTNDSRIDEATKQQDKSEQFQLDMLALKQRSDNFTVWMKFANAASTNMKNNTKA